MFYRQLLALPRGQTFIGALLRYRPPEPNSTSLLDSRINAPGSVTVSDLLIKFRCREKC